MIETQEDIYVGSIETDRGVREQVRFYDTRGLRDGLELPKHCFSCTDGYVLVYSTDSKESFKRVELLKKEIDKSKDKKEVSAPWAAGCDLLPLLTASPRDSPSLLLVTVTGSLGSGCWPGMLSEGTSTQQGLLLWAGLRHTAPNRRGSCQVGNVFERTLAWSRD